MKGSVMTVTMSPVARRSREQRVQRRAAMAPDILALLEEGRRQRADLLQQAKDAAALVRIQARATRRLAVIQQTRSPASRARMLDKLADWLSGSEVASVLARASRISASPRLWLRHKLDGAGVQVITRASVIKKAVAKNESSATP